MEEEGNLKAAIRIIKFRRWFPADDEIATTMARLCILREDYYLAVMALAADDLPALDQNGKRWRALYFVRQITATLNEVKRSLVKLETSREFQQALDDSGEGFRKTVEDLLQSLRESDVKEIRNNVGGHIKYEAVRETLETLSARGIDEGIIDSGPTHKDIHLKFTSDIVAAMLSVHKKDEEPVKVTVERLGDKVLTARFFDAFDRIISAYCKWRHLL